MTRRHSRARQSTLTATDWELILTALGAYQHHAAYRDLHGKVALLAEAAADPRHAVALPAAARDAPGVNGSGHPALMG